MFQRMSCLHENEICNVFFTLSVKIVNVISGCDVKATNEDYIFLADI